MLQKFIDFLDDDDARRKLLKVGAIVMVAILVISGIINLFDKDEKEKKPAANWTEDDMEETLTSDEKNNKETKEENTTEEAETEINALPQLQASAWVRDLGDGTKEYLVFEPADYDGNRGQTAHIYIENPAADITVRYYNDARYNVELDGDIMYLTYKAGHGSGDRASVFSINGNILTYNGCTYTAFPTTSLVHRSYGYGTGEDENARIGTYTGPDMGY